MKRLIACAMSAGLIAGGAVAAEFKGTLKRISDSGTIQIGYRETEPPMSFRTKDGKPVGYSIDLCLRIVAAVKIELGKPGITVKYVPVTAASRFPAIQNGTIDILCGSTTKTLSRSKLVDFSQLTFITGASLLSRKDAKVMGISALQNKKVAVVRAPTTIDALKRALTKSLIDSEVVSVGSASEGLKALEAGKVSALASDQVVLVGLAITAKNPDLFFLSPELFSYEPFAFAVRRDDADFRLVVDRALAQIYRSKQIAQIYNKWFGQFAAKPPGLLRAMYRINETPE
jgi:glutamate/aspartate transport system substrate-binding protein